MNQLKQLIKENLASEPLQIIYWSSPQKGTFQQALHIYKHSSSKQKQSIQNRAILKLQKYKQPKTGLAILCLLDYLISDGYRIHIGNRPNLNVQQCKSEKERVSELGFFTMYFQYLSIKASMSYTSVQREFQDMDINAKIQFCQNLVKLVFKIVMQDFLIQYCLGKSENKSIIKIIVDKILYNTSKQLRILNKFVQVYWQKILHQDKELSFRTNQIYEKCIFFRKKAEVFERLNRKNNSIYKFQFLQFNRQINSKIQSKMFQRQQQKRQFISQKYIREKKQSQKVINDESMPKTCTDLISQDQILIEHQQFFN